MQTNETLLLRILSQEEVSEIYHTHTVYDLSLIHIFRSEGIWTGPRDIF